MPELIPFRAIRYAPGTDLQRVTCPPYDVISPEEKARLEAVHPHNFVRTILPDPTPAGYESAAKYLRMWLDAGVLIQESEEAFYLYRSDFSANSEGVVRSAGIIGALALADFGDGIYPHENTMPGPKADRLSLMRNTEANLEPLWFVAAQPLEGFVELVEANQKAEPSADVTDIGGSRHRVWSIDPSESESLVAGLGATPLIVADGHHRYETSLTYMKEREPIDGRGPWSYTLALVSNPSDYRPTLRPIHRIVGEVGLEALPSDIPKHRFSGATSELYAEVRQLGPGSIGLVSNQGLWIMESNQPLDSEFLADRIFNPLNAAVRYEHHLDTALAEASRGALVFLLAPVELESVINAATESSRMPPKTTLFWPKPRSGLLARDLRSSG